jgi:hypothetical protein
MGAVGIDSVKVELGHKPNIFEGLLGIAVSCKDEKIFAEAYRTCKQATLEKIGIKANKIVLKAFDISKIAPEHENEFLLPFMDCLSESIERIDVYYTRYNATKLPTVTVYGRDQPEAKNPIEFLRLIANGYPHIVACYYLSEYTNKDTKKIYVDHFESMYTPCWDSLSHYDGLTVVYKGGNCNCLISVADLLLRITIMQLKQKNEGFRLEGLQRIYAAFTWSKKVQIHEMGGNTAILKSVTPYNRRNIDLTPYIARPLVFVPTETLAGIAQKEERDLFEDLPVYEDLANFLFAVKGTFKYFRPDSDIKLCKTGDYFLVLGENTERLFKYLKNCGAPLKKITPEELIKKTS